MNTSKKNILLIGFKHVGKTVIGKALANKLTRKFFDLDLQMELLYEKKFHERLFCRQIMQKRGESFFRDIEYQALQQTVPLAESVISLGGGTPLYERNQELIKESFIIHITAARGTVFERIMLQGRPAFFSPDQNPLDSFNQLWDSREEIYKKIRHTEINNNQSVNKAVNDILEKLHSNGKYK